MLSLHKTLSTAAIVVTLVCATSLAQDATNSAGLPRFQQVNERLYRSGQPHDGSLSQLRGLGINTVINMRGTSARTRAEEAEARALGLNYYNVALPNWGRPQDTRVARILELIAAPESGRVLIHCKEGVDRTGMIVALYRMTHEGWTSQKALAEAEHNGMHRTQFWMRDYVRDYGDRIAKVGPETALKPTSANETFDDHIGDGMRYVERGTFRARKFARLFLNKLR
jgi:protein tyrosine/serine phosphatase